MRSIFRRILPTPYTGGTSDREDGSVTLFNDVVKLSLVEREAAPGDPEGADAGPGAPGSGRGAAGAAGAAGADGAGGQGRLYHKLRWKRPIHVGRTVGPIYAHDAVIAKSHMYIVGKRCVLA